MSLGGASVVVVLRSPAHHPSHTFLTPSRGEIVFFHYLLPKWFRISLFTRFHVVFNKKKIPSLNIKKTYIQVRSSNIIIMRKSGDHNTINLYSWGQRSGRTGKFFIKRTTGEIYFLYNQIIIMYHISHYYRLISSFLYLSNKK